MDSGMIIKTLPNGVVTLTPEDNMAITNGTIVTVDVVFLGKFDNPSNWRDIDAPEPPSPEDEATIEDYQQQIERFGVEA